MLLTIKCLANGALIFDKVRGSKDKIDRRFTWSNMQ